MSNNNEIATIMRRRLICAAYLYNQYRSRQRFRPKKKIRQNTQNVPAQNDWEHLLQEMRLFDPKMCFSFTRLTMKQFDCLLSMVGPHIKKSSVRRQSISEGARLALTLRHLALGDSLPTLALSYRIGRSTVCGIIKETCDNLWTILQPYIKLPSNGEWLPIAEKFHQTWNLPNCIGAVDAKHVIIKASNHSGLNYNKSSSIILFAVCNADYDFLHIDVGAYSSQNNGEVFQESEFGQKLYNDKLNLPEDANLPHTSLRVPYFFVGDESFPLVKHLMRPYSDRSLTKDQEVFNHRLTRAALCTENALGVLVGRFQIFQRVINSAPETANSIIKASVGLHNFIKEQERRMSDEAREYCASAFVDRLDSGGEVVGGGWRDNVSGNAALAGVRRRVGARNSTRHATDVRDVYRDYVNSNGGKVDWRPEFSTQTTRETSSDAV